MSEPDLVEITQWLSAWSAGDAVAQERAFAWVYPQARRIAARRLASFQQADLSATQLAHEALLKLLERPALYQHRQHFIRVFALAVQQELLDHVRRHHAERHGGGQVPVPWHELIETPGTDLDEALRLQQASVHDALDALERLDARKRQCIELFYYLGLDRQEIAKLLQISVPTVDRDLAFAKAWLKTHLDAAPGA